MAPPYVSTPRPCAKRLRQHLTTFAWVATLVAASGCAGRSCAWRRGLPFAAESGGVSAPAPVVGTRASVDVPDDQPVLVVHGEPTSRAAIVYLHPRCAHPSVDLETWSDAASKKGTLVALHADRESCPGIEPAARRWTGDIDAIHARIQAALAAVASARDGMLDSSAVTVIGYSEGAARAEQLAGRFPDAYTHVVLIGAPETPSLAHLKTARSVALLSGEKDRQDLMKTGHLNLQTAGSRARFFELPGASHGEFGPDGGRVMGEVLAWLQGTDHPPAAATSSRTSD